MNSNQTNAFGLPSSGAEPPGTEPPETESPETEPPETEPPETKATVLLLASAMLRPAFVSTVVAGLLTAAFGAVFVGLDGAIAALAGTLLVIACGWFTIAVMRWTSSAPSVVVMAAALSAYGFKFMVLLTLLITLPDTQAFDIDTFAWAILAGAVTWTSGVLAGFVRARVATITPAAGDGPQHTTAPNPRPADSLPLR